jgi:hypothetical protein
VQTAYRCVNVCGWNTDPPSSLQIILTMLLIVGAVLARNGTMQTREVTLFYTYPLDHVPTKSSVRIHRSIYGMQQLVF